MNMQALKINRNKLLFFILFLIFLTLPKLAFSQTETNLQLIPPWQMRLCHDDEDKGKLKLFGTYNERGAQRLLVIDNFCFSCLKEVELLSNVRLSMEALNNNLSLQITLHEQKEAKINNRVIELENNLDKEMIKREAAEDRSIDSWDVIPWVITIGLVLVGGGAVAGAAMAGAF